MWSSSITILSIILVHQRQIAGYNTNRQIVLVKDNCGYYENPVFQVRSNFLQNRIKEVEPSPQFIFLENRVRKEAPYYHHVYQKNPSGMNPAPSSFRSNITPVTFEHIEKSELMSHSGEYDKDEDDDLHIDYDKLWKVGESPTPKSVQALPDVYAKPGDAPPIVDMLTIEKSELTEEAHDLENVEIEERIMKDPQTQTKEVIIERVDARPEPSSTPNPAYEMFKEVDLSQMKQEDSKKGKEDNQKKGKEDNQKVNKISEK